MRPGRLAAAEEVGLDAAELASLTKTVWNNQKIKTQLDNICFGNLEQS